MYQVVENIARFSIFIPLFLYILRKSKTKEIKVIFWFIIFILLHQFAYSTLRNRSLLESANFLNNFYTPIELFFAGIYIRYSVKIFSLKKIIIYVFGFYFLFWMLLHSFFDVLQFDYIFNGVSYSLMILFCLFYLYEQMKSPETLFIYSQTPFWGVVAFLLFASGTFFVFIFDKLAAGSKTFEDQYVYIHAIFFIVRNACFTVAMLINSSKINFTERTPAIT